MVGPASVIDRLELLVGASERLRALNPGASERATIAASGIEITALCIQHDNRPEIDHVGFLIKADGISILHLGDDTGLDPRALTAYGLPGDHVDLAFCNYYGFWRYTSDRIFLSQAVAPSAVVVMHVARQDADFVTRTVPTLTDVGFPFYVFARSLDQTAFTKTSSGFQCIELPHSPAPQ